MRRAFTLIELLAVVAILAVLSALLLPVYARARRSADMTRTISNLHQMGLALSLYRADAGGEGVYGDSYAMGMPENPYVLKPYRTGQRLEFWPSGEADPNRRVLFRRYTTPKEDERRPYPWSRYVDKNHDAAVAFASMSYTDEGVPLHSPFGAFFGLGVRLDASVMKRTRFGNWDSYDWWE